MYKAESKGEADKLQYVPKVIPTVQLVGKGLAELVSILNFESSSRKHLAKERPSTTSDKEESEVHTFSAIVPAGAWKVPCRPHPDELKKTGHSPKNTVQEHGNVFTRARTKLNPMYTNDMKYRWDNKEEKRTRKVKRDRIIQKKQL